MTDNESPPVVLIEDYYDGFAVYVNKKRFYFDQEDDVHQLIKVFEALGIANVTYEEVC